ncbi:MAG: gamma carbonic anhydrase family protein, partial [Thermodesulfobacteriota bacterium]
ILLDDVEVGEDCIVGAGSIVTEGTKAPPGTLLFGTPARVKRDLRPDEFQRIKRSANNYIAYAGDYINGVGR